MRYKKGMKKALFLYVLMLPMVSYAFDFQVVVSSGQTLYFDTVPGGVSVVYPHEGDYASSWNGFVKPTGAMTIPSQVIWQGISYPVVSVSPAAFYHCSGLTSVTIGHGVTTLGNSAFNGCTGIASVELPASLTSVGNQAFGGCSSLTNVQILATTPPTTASGAFYNVSLATCVLHVPCESDSVYETVSPWNAFGTMVVMPCVVTINTNVNNTARGYVTGAGTYSYGTQVTLAAIPNQGYVFICWNDGDTLNPRLVYAVSDTSFVAMFFPLIHDTVVDTIVKYVHDTTVIYDTIDLTPTFFQLQVLSAQPDLGLGVGSALLPAGTEVEVCALPFEGSRFVGWSDGETLNPRRVTVTDNKVVTAYFDRVGVASPLATQWNVSVEGQVLVVSCPSGQNVTVYDIGGRSVASACAGGGPMRFVMPETGVYVVSVDGYGARKVVVE